MFSFSVGGGGQKTNSSSIYAPYIYISPVHCLNQSFKLLNLFLAPDTAEDASADAAADINSSIVMQNKEAPTCVQLGQS